MSSLMQSVVSSEMLLGSSASSDSLTSRSGKLDALKTCFAPHKKLPRSPMQLVHYRYEGFTELISIRVILVVPSVSSNKREEIFKLILIQSTC